MKRGLKEFPILNYLVAVRTVALITPMKRGLKADKADSLGVRKDSCTNYPDEKGTESLLSKCLSYLLSNVALITPMKRGLHKISIGRGWCYD